MSLRGSCTRIIWYHSAQSIRKNDAGPPGRRRRVGGDWLRQSRSNLPWSPLGSRAQAESADLLLWDGQAKLAFPAVVRQVVVARPWLPVLRPRHCMPVVMASATLLAHRRWLSGTRRSVTAASTEGSMDSPNAPAAWPASRHGVFDRLIARGRRASGAIEPVAVGRAEAPCRYDRRSSGRSHRPTRKKGSNVATFSILVGPRR